MEDDIKRNAYWTREQARYEAWRDFDRALKQARSTYEMQLAAAEREYEKALLYESAGAG